MKCPLCGHEHTSVYDTRPIEEGAGIIRRRECDSCRQRFNTIERVDKATGKQGGARKRSKLELEAEAAAAAIPVGSSRT